ncbi:MAG: hypothetical protein ABFD98_15425 [Syntrophobacteraceae bacterium]|nr:hypothetical protein [Desulfobacteraceae bacterium]
MRGLLLLLCLAACCGTACAAMGKECTGVWKMRHLFVTAKAGVEQEGSRIRGVAHVQGLSGRIDAYHFAGTFHGGEITAFHSDGHSFRGRFSGPEEISGVLTTKTGMRLEIRAAHCKPPPEGESPPGDCAPHGP